jgi:hydroxyethylthiazole kinase-like sugar kinase family protein
MLLPASTRMFGPAGSLACGRRLAAEVAMVGHPGGPGTFRAQFLDALYTLGEETVTQGVLISEDSL